MTFPGKSHNFQGQIYPFPGQIYLFPGQIYLFPGQIYLFSRTNLHFPGQIYISKDKFIRLFINCVSLIVFPCNMSTCNQLCNIFFPSLLQSQFWPHLSLRTNVHKGGLKHHQPQLLFKKTLLQCNHHHPYPSVLLIKSEQSGNTLATMTLAEYGCMKFDQRPSIIDILWNTK